LVRDDVNRRISADLAVVDMSLVAIEQAKAAAIAEPGAA
jgi:hypothetical protein